MPQLTHDQSPGRELEGPGHDRARSVLCTLIHSRVTGAVSFPLFLWILWGIYVHNFASGRTPELPLASLASFGEDHATTP